MTAPPAITRPDGRTCRPRKVIAYPVTSDDGGSLVGVVVFGTHDPGRALPLASDYVAWQLDSGYVPVDPALVWWRDGYHYGERAWVDDEERGRPGVWFKEIAERQVAS